MERNARRWGLDLSKTAEFHFRRRYNLPPQDERFLGATVEEILTDLWAHTYADDPKRAEQEVVDDDYDANLDALAAEIEVKMPEGEEPPKPSAAPPPEPPDPGDWETVEEGRW